MSTILKEPHRLSVCAGLHTHTHTHTHTQTQNRLANKNSLLLLVSQADMPLFFPLLVSISCVASPNNGTFQEKMQAKLEELFLEPNGFFNKTVPPKTGAPPGGFWFAFRNATDAITVSLGVSDGKSVSDGGTAAVATDIIPAGSLTKPFTAAAVMRLVETGVVRLEDPVAMHIDPFLTRINGSNTTMEAVWGPMVRNVTIRMLLNMRSGMPDYNDQVIKRDTLWSPDWDIGPQDYFSLVGYSTEKWRFAPDTRSEYFSMGYLMLALVQANHAKQADGSPLTDWAQFQPTCWRASGTTPPPFSPAATAPPTATLRTTTTSATRQTPHMSICTSARA